MMYFHFGFYLVLGLLMFGQAFATTVAPQTYSISIVPQFAPVAIHKDWAPILEKLGAATGLTFEIVVESSIPVFEKSLAEGTPDFAFMNPYHCIIAKRDKGYIPLLRDSAKMLEGILVVRKDSPVTSLNELNGQSVAFPAPNYVKTHSNHCLMETILASASCRVNSSIFLCGCYLILLIYP